MHNPHQALPHIPEEEEEDSSSTSLNTTSSSDSFYSDEMAEPAVITGSQLACIPVYSGEKGLSIISWCESIDRAKVQFNWSEVQAASVATSRAGTKVSTWLRGARLSGTTYTNWSDGNNNLRGALIKRFGPTVTALQSVHAVSDLKQRADESCADFMDRIKLAVDMLHYNVPAATKAAAPYQESFARLVKAHFGAGLRPDIGKVVLGVSTPPATMDAFLEAAEAIESEMNRSSKAPVLAVNTRPLSPMSDLQQKFSDLVAYVKGPTRGGGNRGRGQNFRGRGGRGGRSNRGGQQGSQSTFSNMQCFNCGGYGHTVAICTEPDNPAKQQQLRAAFEASRPQRRGRGSYRRGRGNTSAATETNPVPPPPQEPQWSFGMSGN